MSNRIRDLAFRAGFCRSDEGEFSNTIIGTTHEDALKNFAELLIEECAELAKHHVMNISTYRDAEFVDEQIKQHFGVKE